MRAIAVLVVASCFAAVHARAAANVSVVAAVGDDVRGNVRILVAPIAATGDRDDDEMGKTLTRAVETALGAAVKDVEIVTPAALDTAVEINLARECASFSGDDGDHGAANGKGAADGKGAGDSCLSELADAVDVDVIARPSLGRLGSELVLTLTLLDGDKAVVVAQGLRRADKGAPEALLDQIPGLAKDVARDADLATVARRRRAVPGAAIGTALVGVVVVGVGVGALAVRGLFSGDYASGRLDVNGARAYESIDAPFLYGGIGAVGVGSATALVAGGVAIWSVIAPEE